jgi:hypothetical protein
MTDRAGYVSATGTRMAAVGVASLAVLLLCAGRIWLIPAHFSTDPNEGWNAFQALRALGAGPLYPPPGSLTGNNYPPASFFIVGWAGRTTGDNIVAGRIIAFVSVLVVSGFIFAAVRMMGVRSDLAPTIGILLFLGFNATIFRSYLAMDDPQWLGHAFMTAGLFLLLASHRQGPLEAGRVVVAALLVLVGGFVKHNLFAFPLAATLWLMLHDRRALLVWIITSALALVAAAALLYDTYGTAFFADLMASDRHYSWWRAALRSAVPIGAMLPMILVTSRLWKARRTDRRIDLLLLMVAISVPLGIFERSGQGVDRNAHFEALIALSISTSVSLGRCGLALEPLLLRPAPWLIVPFLVLLPSAFQADMEELLHRTDRQTAWNVMQDRVAAIPGRVACETSAICYWAGKRFEIDFFLYGQHIAMHHDAAALARALAERRFAAIELDRPSRLPPGEIGNPLRALIPRSYRPVLVDDEGHRLFTPVR